jgi:hypothetical protein
VPPGRADGVARCGPLEPVGARVPGVGCNQLMGTPRPDPLVSCSPGRNRHTPDGERLVGEMGRVAELAEAAFSRDQRVR